MYSVHLHLCSLIEFQHITDPPPPNIFSLQVTNRNLLVFERESCDGNSNSACHAVFILLVLYTDYALVIYAST